LRERTQHGACLLWLTCNFLHWLVVLRGFRGERVCPGHDGGHRNQRLLLLVLCLEQDLEGCGDLLLRVHDVEHDHVRLEDAVLHASGVAVRPRLLAPLRFVFLGVFGCAATR